MSSRSYEVRCPRCDVTFPIETKRCVHCGGATGKGATISLRGTRFGTKGLGDYSGTGADSGRTTAADYDLGRDTGSPAAGEDEIVLADADASSSLGKSILGSMGSVIWILLLVGFSLARSCGE
ncbi:MAG: hypothetical protein AB8G23_13505 [Myxococcota bacterium]